MSMLALQRALPRLPASVGLRIPVPLALSLLATALLLLATLLGQGPPLSDWLGDADDALRLVTVRELLAGAPWFDTTLPRIGAPEPLLSHWSRLIDAPLALLVAMLSPLLGPEAAELATRAVWPATLFAVLAFVVAREAHRRGGPVAAVFALFLILTSALALAQFKPGRIDHHNAQILCAVAGLLFLARSSTSRRCGRIAGVLIGTGLAIGYEAIALVVPALALAALAAIRHPRSSAGPVEAAWVTAAVLSLALIATVPPARWLDVRCDSLSLNLPVVAAFAAGGLWAASLSGSRFLVRLGILALAVICGGALYAALEPACLAGPFGQTSAALGPIWLDHVLETSSLLWLARTHPATAAAVAAFLLAGVAAQVSLWRRQPDVETGLAMGFVALATVLGCWQLKLLPYATWLAALPVAVWAARLPGTASLSVPVVRIGAVVLLSQATLEAGFDMLVAPFRHTAGPAVAAAASRPDDPRRPCFLSGNVRRLAALPPGLVAGDIDLGPYIAALTPHRLLAAPYHRLEGSILANHAILTGKPDQALARMRRLGVDYLALCADAVEAGSRRAAQADPSLRALLLAGERIDVLPELPLPVDSAVRVWRAMPVR
jgi:hypothetical protein